LSATCFGPNGPSQARNRVTTDAHDTSMRPQNAARPNTKEDTITIQNYKKMCSTWTYKATI